MGPWREREVGLILLLEKGKPEEKKIVTALAGSFLFRRDTLQVVQ